MGIHIGGKFLTCICHGRPYDAETGYHPGRFNGVLVTRVIPGLAICWALLFFAKWIFPSAVLRIPDYILVVPFGAYLFLYGMAMKRGYIGFFRKQASRVFDENWWMIAGGSLIVIELLLAIK